MYVCEKERVNQSTDLWARLCWLSLCPGFLLWQLAERVGPPQLMALWAVVFNK